MTLPYVSIFDRQLTQNFWLYEFLRSDTAAKHKIDNTPHAAELENIGLTAVMMQAVRDLLSDHFGAEIAVTITSGFRSDAVNRHKDVRGSSTSDHRLGLAADFKAARLLSGEICDPMVCAQVIAKSPLQFDQLLHYRRSRNHLGFGSRNRREIKTQVGQRWVQGLRP